MEVELKGTDTRPYRGWERIYTLIAALFALVTLATLGYGLWYAFEFADTGDSSDLARFLTSGFLFLFSGLASVGMWLRLTNIHDNRRMIARIGQLVEPSNE